MLLKLTLLCMSQAFDLIGWYIKDSGCGNRMNYTNFLLSTIPM